MNTITPSTPAVTAAPKPRVNRWFVRCPECISVSAVETNPMDVLRTSGAPLKCAICECPVETMGRVARDPNILVTGTRYDCPCDGRCTGAKGPSCDCSCGGANHGTNMVVEVQITERTPRITPPDEVKARARRAEYLALVEQVRATCPPAGKGFYDKVRTWGSWSCLRPDERRCAELYMANEAVISQARKSRTQKGRCDVLRKFLEKVS